MKTLVEQIRMVDGPLTKQAAAEIERLTADNERLRTRITKAGVMVDQGYGYASISEFLWSAINEQKARQRIEPSSDTDDEGAPR